MGAGFKTENLAAFGKAAGRLNAFSAAGATMRARVKGTLRRRLPPQAKRQITAKFNIAPSVVVKRLRCFFDETSVSLVAAGTRTYLSNYGPRQNRTGVYVEIVKGEPVNLPHAFIRAPAGGGFNAGRGVAAGTVFCRAQVLDECLAAGNGRVQAAQLENGRDGHGYPIAFLLGPTAADMMAEAGVEDEIIDFAGELFAAEVDRLAGVARGS